MYEVKQNDRLRYCSSARIEINTFIVSLAMLTALNPLLPDQAFPPVENALDEPDGLLAVGGCLSPKRIINAYRHGIFPWFSSDQPILWWSPNPRLVLLPGKLQQSRSLLKTIRQGVFSVSFDTAFPEVVNACSGPRKDQTETWISDDMKKAYNELHRLGFAHSIETWRDGQLAGGLYGIAIGQVFFGESMFHRKTDASKVAFAVLVETLINWHYQLIDCQVHSSHLVSLGAEEISRLRFIQLINEFCNKPPDQNAWKET